MAQTLAGISQGLIMNVLGAIAVIGVAILGFYGTRWYQSQSKKQKSFKITAIIINPHGEVATDKLAILKTVDGMLVTEFQKRKQDKIPPIELKLLRNNQIMLFHYAPGQYAPIDPTTWSMINLRSHGIRLVNNNMKNFAHLEQRAAVHRWAQKQDKIKQLTPWITLGIVAIAATVIAWFLLKTTGTLFTQATQQRYAECSTVCAQYSPVTPPGVTG